MKAIKAIALSLAELDSVAISRYHIGIIVDRIYQKKSYKGSIISQLSKDFAEKSDVSRYLEELIDDGIISPYKNLSGIYKLTGRADADPEDIVCAIDPFCYLSHLSAMSHHGLTDRIPSKIFITSPANKEWRNAARKQMEKDLGDELVRYQNSGLPNLVRPKMTKIKKVEIHCSNSRNPGAFRNVHGRDLRVSTVGRTFLDMLKSPDLCGGINHVLDVFEDMGTTYIKPIISEIDNHGAPIDKVRAGYIFNEMLGIDDNKTIVSWEKYAQRGGSRKLDPKSEYIPEWSDKWQISLNVYR